MPTWKKLALADTAQTFSGVQTFSDNVTLDLNTQNEGLIIKNTHYNSVIDFHRASTATARIQVHEPGAVHTSSLLFYTSDADSSAPNLQLAFMIGSDLKISTYGDMDVGNSSIADTTINIESSSSGDPKLNFKSTSNRSANIDFTEGGTLQGSIFYKHNGDTLGISTGSTNRTARLSINETTSTLTSNLSLEGSLIGDSTNFDIYQTSSDTSDNRRTRIGGGGDVSQSRGAYIELAGNEHSNTGQLILNAGNVSGGDILFKTNNTTRLTIKKAGDASFTGWIEGNGENALYSNTSTGLLIQAPDTTEEIHFRDKNGSVGMLYNAGTKKLGIGDDSPTELLEIASDSDPTIIIRTDTADQANSGKISFREAAGGSTGADLRYDGSANNFIIDTSDVSNALVIARTTGRVGINTASPDQTMHIHKASAGSIASDSNTVLTVENSDHSLIQILSPEAKDGAVMFGNPTDGALDGRLVYDNADRALQFWTAGTQRVTIDSSGNATFTGNISVGDTGYLTGGVSTQDRIGFSAGSLDLKARGNATIDIDSNDADTNRTFKITHNGGTQLLSIDESGHTTITGNFTTSGGQLLTPSGVNLALNPNTGVVTVGGEIQTTSDIIIPATKTLWLDGDGDTGLRETSANNILLFANGVTMANLDGASGTVFNEDGADLDFRIESDTKTHALFVQGSDGFIGVNDDSPAGLLTLKSAIGGSADIFWIKADDGGNLFRLGKDASDDAYFEMFDGGGTKDVFITTDGDSYFNGGDVSFSGDIQAAGVYVGSTNTSYDFYNNGTTYLNGATTIDADTSITGQAHLVATSGNSWTALKTSGAVEMLTSSVDSSEKRFSFAMGGASDSGTLSLYNGDGTTVGTSISGGDANAYFSSTSGKRLHVGTIEGNAGIEATNTSDSSDHLRLKGYTLKIGKSATDLVLDSSGNATFGAKVGIGVDATSDFEIKMATDKHMHFSDSQGETGNCPTIHAVNTAGSANVDLGFRGSNLIFATGSAERMRTTDTGLGIGTDSPDGTLHVHTATSGDFAPATYADDLIVENSGDGGITIATPDANEQYILFSSPSNNGTYNALIYSCYNSNQEYLAFNTHGGGEVMRLDHNGDVVIPDQLGIGLSAGSTPADVLHIVSASDGGATEVIIDNSAAGDSTDELVGFRFRHNGGTAARILVGREENFSGSSTRSGFISLRTSKDDSESEKMRITADGNVGIGETSPDYKFEVVGDYSNPSATAAATAVVGISAGASGSELVIGGEQNGGKVWIQNRHKSVNGYAYEIAFQPQGGTTSFGGPVNFSSITGSISVPDTQKIGAGDSTDIWMTHSTHSYIENKTGEMRIVQGSGDHFSIWLDNASGTDVKRFAIAPDGKTHVGGGAAAGQFNVFNNTSDSKKSIVIDTGTSYQSWSIGYEDVSSRINLVIQKEYGDGSWGNALKIMNDGGQIQGTGGSAAKPTYSFIDQASTGMYKPGTNQLYFSVGGTRKMRVESTQIVLEDDVSVDNTLTVGDDVTINSTDAGAGASPALTLTRNSASPAMNDLLGIIEFKGEDTMSASETYADITGKIGDPTHTAEDGVLRFRTMQSGTLGDAMYINQRQIQGANGSLSTPTYSFWNDTDTGLFLTEVGGIGISVAGSQALSFNSSLTATFGGDVYIPANLVHSGDANNYIGFQTDRQDFVTDGTTALTIDSSQSAIFSGTIVRSATNNSTGTAWTAIGDGNIPHISIRNLSTTDGAMAGLFFRDDQASRAGVHARFLNHTDGSESAELVFSTTTGGNTRERVTISENGDTTIIGTTNYSQLRIKGAGEESGIRFLDSGGNTDGYIYANASNIGFLASNGSWKVKHEDNGSYFSNSIYVPWEIVHTGDTDTRITFDSNNVSLRAGGTVPVSANHSNVIMTAGSGVSMKLDLISDNGANNADNWRLSAETDHMFEIQSKDGGSFASVVEWSGSDKAMYAKGNVHLSGTTLSLAGTASVDSYLRFDGGSGDTYLHYNANDMIDVYTGGDIAMRIKDDDVEFNGAISTSGRIEGKYLVTFIHNFSDDIGTTEHAIPWAGTGEQTNANASQVAYMAPFAMTLKKIILRPETITDAAATFKIFLKKQDDGDTTDDTVATQTSAGSHNNNTAFTLSEAGFSATPSVGALDKVSLHIKASVDPSSTIDWYITSVWEVTQEL